MISTPCKKGKGAVLLILPQRIRREIENIAASQKHGLENLREVRLRVGGGCSANFGGNTVRLCTEVTREDRDGVMKQMCDGSPYAHRETLAEGYLYLDGGVRVGVCGTVRYDGEQITSISEVCSLLFRIPGGECEFAEELFGVWQESGARGMMIYSPPGVGKTTALRSLAMSISGGNGGLSVAVIDERREFVPDEYAGHRVDILRGYRKSEGIEIATRTLSPDVIIVDELGHRDCAAIMKVMNCGVPIIATAHASSVSQLFFGSSMREIFDIGLFETFVGIERDKGSYRLTVDRI